MQLSIVKTTFLAALVASCVSAKTWYPVDSSLAVNRGISIEPQKQESQISEIQRLADQGDAEAQYKLGVMSYYGIGIPLATIEGRKSLEKAERQGHAGAMYQLGLMYLFNWGVAQNFLAAETYFARAANHDHSGAQFQLGNLKFFGITGVREEDEAIKWWKRAASLGHGAAHVNLGSYYSNTDVFARGYYLYSRVGLGQDGQDQTYSLDSELAEFSSPQADNSVAFKWFLKGAEYGDPWAQLATGLMLAEGIGVETNKIEAMKWFVLSANQDLASGENARKVRAFDYTRDQLEKAQQLADSWKKISE